MIDAVVGAVIMVVMTTSLVLASEALNRSYINSGTGGLSDAESSLFEQSPWANGSEQDIDALKSDLQDWLSALPRSY